MIRNAQCLVIQRLDSDESLQAYFKSKTGLRFTVTTNPNEIVPPSGFLSLAGGEIYAGGRTSEISFSMIILLPQFKDTFECLEALDGILISLFRIKNNSGMVTSIRVGDMIPPVEGDPSWTIPITIVMTI